MVTPVLHVLPADHPLHSHPNDYSSAACFQGLFVRAKVSPCPSWTRPFCKAQWQKSLRLRRDVDRLAAFLSNLLCPLELVADCSAHGRTFEALVHGHHHRIEFVRAQDGGDVVLSWCDRVDDSFCRRLCTWSAHVPHRYRLPSGREDALREHREVRKHGAARARSARVPPRRAYRRCALDNRHETRSKRDKVVTQKMVSAHLPFPTSSSCGAAERFLPVTCVFWVRRL